MMHEMVMNNFFSIGYIFICEETCDKLLVKVQGKFGSAD